MVQTNWATQLPVSPPSQLYSSPSRCCPRNKTSAHIRFSPSSDPPPSTAARASLTSAPRCVFFTWKISQQLQLRVHSVNSLYQTRKGRGVRKKSKPVTLSQTSWLREEGEGEHPRLGFVWIWGQSTLSRGSLQSGQTLTSKRHPLCPAHAHTRTNARTLTPCDLPCPSSPACGGACSPVVATRQYI